MLDCISAKTMRDSDAWTIANRVPGLELMYRAAMGVFRTVAWQGRAAILCGSGNNGGMNGDTGEGSCIVHSDQTVTIGYVKHGLVTENAGRYIKRLVCAPIGIELIREEVKIAGAGEWDTLSAAQKQQAILCPLWLDMTPV